MPPDVRLRADELNQFGERLGRALRGARGARAVVIGLSGELGSGKTTLVQAICRGLGAGAAVTSPTYALVHRYPADRAIYHVDCYRLKDPDDARDLGFDDMLREGAIVLIEWPERAGPWAPPLDRHLKLAHDPDPGIRVVEEG
jgi:tRNA threonylcarbamoyladenosine biosynthesis protein TsaE